VTREQQLALIEIFITEAERRATAGINDGKAFRNLVAILKETGFLIVVARLEDSIDLETDEAIGGD
jgi:hypothetical protein